VDQCCDIACGWSDRLQTEIQKSYDEGKHDAITQNQEKHHRFLLYALLSYEMIPICPSVVLTESRTRTIIRLSLQITNSRPEELSVKATNLIKRAHLFLFRIFSAFRELPASWNTILTAATRQILPNYLSREMIWQHLDSLNKSYCWCTTDMSGNHISINIINGIVLVNGLPPSQLPSSIIRHRLFQRV
jgi:hypothetical protein